MGRMRRYVVPMQSMVVADATGHIGLIAPGRVPIRDPANKMAGRAPVPGWDATYDWKGYLSFDQIPRAVGPAAGAIATANARIVGADYRHFLTLDWDPSFRANRINEIVVRRDAHDLASMRAAQADVFSPAVSQLQPLMIAKAQTGAGVDMALLDQLTIWDATMTVDASEPLIFTAWIRETVRAVYQDDLGPTFDRFFDAHADALLKLLRGEAKGRDWCDDRSTPAKENCGEVLAAALAVAIRDLEHRYGRDRTKWKWGVAHAAQGEHRPFGLVPRLAWLFNIEVPSPGDDYSINRGEMDFNEENPFANRHASSYRGIYDFADLERSLYIQTTGQSGNVFSPWYRNFAERWSRVEYIEIPTNRDEIRKIAAGTWRLAPKGAGG
jgi:penicillin amidase